MGVPYRKRTEAVHNRSTNHATSLYPSLFNSQKNSMILHVLPWDSKGNHGSVRKRARAIQCHRGGATCLVASDGSLVGATRTVRGGGWGTAFSTWLLKKGVFPWATAKCNADSRSHVEFCHSWYHTSRHIFCIFWSEVQLPVLEIGAIFLCLNSGMFLCVVHELCEVGRCRTSFQGAQDHCVKESVNILINILINICKY